MSLIHINTICKSSKDNHLKLKWNKLKGRRNHISVLSTELALSGICSDFSDSDQSPFINWWATGIVSAMYLANSYQLSFYFRIVCINWSLFNEESKYNIPLEIVYWSESTVHYSYFHILWFSYFFMIFKIRAPIQHTTTS